MPKHDKSKIVEMVELLKRARNKTHLHHLLNNSGSGAHRDKTTYSRKGKQKFNPEKES